MQIVINLDNISEMELRKVALELHETPQSVIKTLKNIYLANLCEDLAWVAAMRQEDKELEKA